MNWNEKLENWYLGKDLPNYPEYIDSEYIWETSPITKNFNEIYKEKFIKCEQLSYMNESFESFNEHIKNSLEENAISFLNLSKYLKKTS